jgi:hypothetical protein
MTFGMADGRQVAPLLAELADQDAVGREHPQRQLGPVVGQLADVGQVGVGDRQGHPTTHSTDSAPAAAMPKLQKKKRRSHFSQVGRRGGGVLAGPLGLDVSCMEGRRVTGHYKKPLPSHDPIFVALASA